MASRSLEEKAALNEELGRRAEAEGRATTAERFATGANQTKRAAELVRQLVLDIGEAQDQARTAEPGPA